MLKFFHRDSHKQEEASAPAPALDCPHTVLLPRWDRAQDMGNDALATSFVCEACHRPFSAEEGRALQATASARLPVEEAPAEVGSPTNS